MNRRDFLQRAGLIAAGVVAADQLDLIKRLGWKRRLFPGWRADHPLQRAPIIQVVDQYGAVYGEAEVISWTATFNGITVHAHPYETIRLSFVGATELTHAAQIPWLRKSLR